MKRKIIFSVISLIALSTFTYYYYIYTGITNTVSTSTLKEQSKINMTGAIGVLESIYVHNAFQCIIGAAPVAIFVKKNSADTESTLLSSLNTTYGKPRHGNDLRNSP